MVTKSSLAWTLLEHTLKRLGEKTKYSRLIMKTNTLTKRKDCQTAFLLREKEMTDRSVCSARNEEKIFCTLWKEIKRDFRERKKEGEEGKRERGERERGKQIE